VRVRGVREIADVATAEDGVWISAAGDQRVLRLDLSTGRVRARSPRLGADTVEIAAVGGSAWVDLGEADALAHVDARGRILQRRVPNGGDVFALAIGYGSVWVTNYARHEVRRFDAETGRLQRRIPVGREPKGITAEVDGGVWVANAGECTLSRIQPR
jgi:streptogramin lyase